MAGRGHKATSLFKYTEAGPLSAIDAAHPGEGVNNETSMETGYTTDMHRFMPRLDQLFCDQFLIHQFAGRTRQGRDRKPLQLYDQSDRSQLVEILVRDLVVYAPRISTS